MSRPDDSHYRRAIRSSAAKPGSGFIVLDTLGALRAHGHGLVGHCVACARLYRRHGPSPPSSFHIDLGELIAERGEACSVIGLKSIACPYCGSHDTRMHITTPPRDVAR